MEAGRGVMVEAAAGGLSGPGGAAGLTRTPRLHPSQGARWPPLRRCLGSALPVPGLAPPAGRGAGAAGPGRGPGQPGQLLGPRSVPQASLRTGPARPAREAAARPSPRAGVWNPQVGRAAEADARLSGREQTGHR